MINHEDILLDILRIEREARQNVLRKIAARQLGEAWVGIDTRRTEERGEEFPRRLPNAA
jgi:hypothetical protein